MKCSLLILTLLVISQLTYAQPDPVEERAREEEHRRDIDAAVERYDEEQRAKETASPTYNPGTDLMTGIFSGLTNSYSMNTFYKAYLKHAQSGQFDLAVIDVTKMLRISPEDGSLYNLRAGLYIELKKYDSAYNDASKAINLDMNNGQRRKQVANYFYNRGNAAFKLEKFEQCVTDMRHVIIRQKNYWEAYLMRGYARNALYDTTDAVADFTVFIDSVNYEPGWAYEGRAVAWYRRKQYDKALLDFDSAMKIYPDDLDLIVGRGKAARMLFLENKSKSPEDSSKYLHMALEAAGKAESQKDNANYNLFIGNCMIAMDSWHEGLRYINKSIQLAGDKSSGAAYASRGYCSYRLKSYLYAVQDYEQALKIDGNNKRFAYSDYYEDAKKQLTIQQQKFEEKKKDPTQQKKPVIVKPKKPSLR